MQIKISRQERKRLEVAEEKGPVRYYPPQSAIEERLTDRELLEVVTDVARPKVKLFTITERGLDALRG